MIAKRLWNKFHLLGAGIITVLTLLVLTTTCSLEGDWDQLYKEAKIKYPFTVSFNSGSGATTATPESIEVVKDEKIVLPNNYLAPTGPNGENFGWWFKEDTFQTPWDFENDTITKNNTTLYAGYTANSSNYFVVFFGNNKNAKFPDNDGKTFEVKQSAGAVIANMANVQLTGYSLKNWNTKPDGSGTPYTIATDISGLGYSIAVYAQWQIDYTVTFNLNSTDGVWNPSLSDPVSPANPQTRIVKYPATTLDTIMPADPTRPNYVFDGWKTTAGIDFTSTTQVTSNLTVNAQWVPLITFTLELIPDTGATTTGLKINLTRAPIDPLDDPDISVSTPTGSSADVTQGALTKTDDKTYTLGISVTDPGRIAVKINNHEDISVTPVEVTVIKTLPAAEAPVFTADIGSTNNANYVYNSSVAQLSVIVAPISDGGTISISWYKNDTESTGGTLVATTSGPLTSDYTPLIADVGVAYYYAVATNSHSGVTIAASTTSGFVKITTRVTVIDITQVGGVSDTTTTTALTIKLSHEVSGLGSADVTIAPDSANGTAGAATKGVLTGPVQNGVNDYVYTLPVTNVTQGDILVTVTKGDLIVNDPISVTVYKTVSTTYNVTYDGNGSTGGTVPVDSTDYEPNDTVTVKGNTGGLAKTGSTFDGWNTVANGSGTSYIADGTDTFTITDNTTLYAQWVAINYNVTYDENGSTGGSVPTDSNNYLYNDTVTVSANTGTLVKTGSTF
ncbi:MAG: InlB B-repeat-containing protein, partial [Treponema sp.]|nr:InlB B-repeat-containing protein [Treponema sp.]